MLLTFLCYYNEAIDYKVLAYSLRLRSLDVHSFFLIWRVRHSFLVLSSFYVRILCALSSQG